MARTRAKVVGLPPEAPRCNHCYQPLKPMYTSDWDRDKNGALIAGTRTLTFYGWRGYEGFHSLRCALAFAVKAYRAGFALEERGSRRRS